VEEIRGRLRALAGQGRLRYVVLVGDADSPARMNHPASNTTALPVRRPAAAPLVPTGYAPARVIARWGSAPLIATDNPYGDLNNDGRPELAVGRLAVDSAAELQAVVQKILNYERSGDAGLWHRRINVVAGVGGFGILADRVIESAARYFLVQHVPAEYRVTMTYASWRSPYCPDPRLFRRTTLQRLNEGAWFWVYVGHGRATELDWIRVPGGWQRILGVEDLQALDRSVGRPIALILACQTGAFDAESECLAEQMLRHPQGPVAVLAGSRVTMPYGMSVLARELLKQCFHRRTDTLGLALLKAKQAMLEPPEAGDKDRALLDVLAQTLSPPPVELDTERREHVQLFNLLGDPLLRLKYPRKVVLEVPEQATAGHGRTTISGLARVELTLPRGVLPVERPQRAQMPEDAEQLARFQEVYEQANDGCLSAVNAPVIGGRFEATLEVPRDFRGDCQVRVFVAGREGFAAAAVPLRVSPEAHLSSGATAGASPAGLP